MTATDDLAARFERDVLPLRSLLSRGARRLTFNDADAEDLLQDTLLAAYRGFGTFRSGTNLQAWLFRIMHNSWVNAHRRRQCRPDEVTVEGFRERELVRGADRTSHVTRSAELLVLESLPDSRIRAALAALPEAQSLVLYYADVQGFTYAETAATLGIPIGTVMSRVSRGRRRLRVSLADMASGQHAAAVGMAR